MIANATEATNDTGLRVATDMPAAEYHAHAAVGSSMLETFRACRFEYFARYVEPGKHDAPPKEETPAMQLGTLVHLRLLEPLSFAEMVAEPLPELAPDGKKWLRRQGSDHERWWQEELDKRAGKIACDAARLALVESIAAAIKRHPRWKSLAEDGGAAEYSLFWIDRDTGIECKCRIDWLKLTGVLAALDIKTTQTVTPGGYSRQCVTLGYHRKLAHYTDGLLYHFRERVPLLHVAAETKWPHRVGIYDIDDLDREGTRLGQLQRRATLRDLADCLAKDDWREPWEKQITSIRLPGYAFTENEYQMGASDGGNDD